MELLLDRTMTTRGVSRYLVRCVVRPRTTSADDERLRAEELLHCPEKAAEYDAAAPRRRRAGHRVGPADVSGGRPGRGGGVLPPVKAAPLLAPAGFRLAAQG